MKFEDIAWRNSTSCFIFLPERENKKPSGDKTHNRRTVTPATQVTNTAAALGPYNFNYQHNLH